MNSTRFCFALLSLLVARASAHDLASGEAHPHYDWSVKPPEFFLAQANTPQKRARVDERPAQAAAFEKFASAVNVRRDERWLFVESSGLPAHNMMVGITAWQQQVPLPQSYTGANAWQIPLSPVPAKEPASIKNRFLRGAIAIAANGIPIFNPQNNRGEISAEIGELDEWGGHCGRADDYHYHAAPLHLQSVLGEALPIAYALDGYPIYGLTEPDGATPAGLDTFNGHETKALGYHYHASTKYPYVNGGFHGEVIERDGQVDPQPSATPVRQHLQALRGAKITGFEYTGANSKLSYEVNGDRRAVLYTVNADGTMAFEFQNGREGTVKETYTRRERGGGQGGPRPEGERREGNRRGAPQRDERGPRRDPDPAEGPRKPWIQVHGAELDADRNGTITEAEFVGEAKRTFAGYDSDRDGSLARGEFTGPGGVRGPMGGFVKEHAAQLDANGDGAIAEAEFIAAMQRMLEREDRNRDGRLSADEWRDISSAPPGEPERPRRGGGDGLIKPTIADTMKLNVYADNWFMLYVNGRLVAVDPIQFTPHNVVSVDFLPEYPMTLAVLAKDNADPRTGMEYGTSIGDGGFILKFGDGTVTNATWKAKSFFHGPLGSDTTNTRVRHEPLPANWWAVDFDDRAWAQAREFSEREVNPKQPYFEADFAGAKWIWSDDLALDNTVIFRTRIEKPGWTPRWNTKPDLDVTGAPLK